MENQSYLPVKSSPSGLHVLYRPILLISLGLHGLLLAIPMPEKPKPEPPPPKQENVKISDLLAPPPQPSPKPSPELSQQASKPIPKASLKRTASISQQRAEPSTPPLREKPIPKTTQMTEQEPEQNLTKTREDLTQKSEQKSTQAQQQEQNQPETQQQKAPLNPNAEAEAKEFEALFGSVDTAVSEKLIDHNLFKQPEAFYLKESLEAFEATPNPEAEPERKPGIARIEWISLKRPDEVFTEIIEPDLKSKGMPPSQQGEYGGGVVYQIKRGSLVRYINLVPTKGSPGTLIVVWNRDPNLPTE